MTNIKDIAKKAGVSTAAVSIALHGGSGRKRVSSERAEQIRRIASSLNYRPNSAARMMTSNKTRQIGVLLRNAPDIPMRNPANFETILGIGEVLSGAGYLQVLVPLSRIENEISRSNRVFSERLLDGIIVMDVHSSRLYAFVRRNFRHSIFLDTNCWNKFSCLRRDERKSGALAAEALKRSGYKKIIYVGPGRGQSPHYSVLERFEGVNEVLGTADGVAFETEEVNGAEYLENLKLHLSRETGIICYDTLIARTVHSHLSQSGLVPPRDYGLACCDDSHETYLTFPMLSRVDFNRYEMGKLAAEMIVGSMESKKRPPSRLFDVSWIPGGTIKSKG
ncbi:MAG TPA: hypothetical protein DCZ94_18070 [Lentisphaeria bacterium]|nr:MAG: hypothetical protein A2X48_00735 [Lentisphaerae bacterium GWF2_49_21]HBC88853.1 hypothetical protein [Lentisphaeria bacterium]